MAAIITHIFIEMSLGMHILNAMTQRMIIIIIIIISDVLSMMMTKLFSYVSST